MISYNRYDMEVVRRCSIKGKTVRGYVTGIENEAGERDTEFFMLNSEWKKIGIEKPLKD